MNSTKIEPLLQSSNEATGPAILWRGGSYSYATLRTMIEDRCRALAVCGIGTRAVVAIEAVRGLDALIDIQALWSIGCTVMPFPSGSEIHLVDKMVRNSNASWSLYPGGLPQLATVTEVSRDEGLPMLILPTSGSTGEPKLVPLRKPEITAFFEWANSAFELSRRTVLAFAPVNFDLSLLEIWATLANGGTVDLISNDEALNPHALRKYLDNSSIDLIQAVPFVFQTLKAPAEEPQHPLTGIRDVIVTGSKAGHETRVHMADLFPNAVFHNIYGSTETNNSFMFTMDALRFVQRETPPIGIPLVGVEAHILDHDGNVLAGQATGELYVRTPFMMKGYLGSNDEVSELFATGDVVCRSHDGTYHIESRSSRIVKVRGNRISLDQVEAVLDAHLAVEQSVVLARTNLGSEPWIEALVKFRVGYHATALQLRTHCSQHLPAFAMPGVVRIVQTSFPLTSTHKIDRNATENIHYGGTANV